MRDLIIDPLKARPWAKLARGEVVNWDEVVADCSSACDWPSADFYRELAGHYPEAKVILTVRDPEAWFKSCSNTIFSELNAVMRKDQDDLGQTMRAIATRHFGGDTSDHDRCIAEFVRHSEEVKHTIPADRLLIYDVAEG